MVYLRTAFRLFACQEVLTIFAVVMLKTLEKMGTEIVIALVGLFCSLVSSVVTFLLTKKKYGAEVESQQIQNMNDSFEVYKKTMHQSMDLQNKRIEELERENATLREEVKQLKDQLTTLLLSKVIPANKKNSK